MSGVSENDHVRPVDGWSCSHTSRNMLTPQDRVRAALAIVANKNAGKFTTKLSIWTYLSFLLTIPANRRATLVG
jgi:hypothetical protein